MSKQETLETTFSKILEEEALHKVKKYEKNDLKKKLSEKESQLLAFLFVLRGERELFEKDQIKKTLHSFEWALKFEPKNLSIYLKQGLIFLNYGVSESNVEILEYALEILEKALLFFEDSFEATYCYAQILTETGSLKKDFSTLDQGDQAFQRAEKLCNDLSNTIRFYWKWGQCYFYKGILSGEPIELRKALDLFEKAQEFGCTSENYRRDNALALFHLGGLLREDKMLVKALSLQKEVTKNNRDFLADQQVLALMHRKRFVFFGYQSSFNEVIKIYRRLAKWFPKDSSIFVEWGLFLSMAGALQENEQYFEESFQQFARADRLRPKDVNALVFWGKTLVQLGNMREDFALLKKGQAKIQEALEIDGKDPAILEAYALVLRDLGIYFEDESYFEKAIQVLTKALAIDDKRGSLWRDLAQTYFHLAEEVEEEELYHKADRCFEKTLFFDSEDPTFWEDWGVTLFNLGQLIHSKNVVANALEKFQKALSFSSDSKASSNLWYHYALTLDFLGDYEGNENYFDMAIEVFRRLLQENPKDYLLRFSFGMVLSHHGNFFDDPRSLEEAIDLFQEIQGENPEDEILAFELGYCLIAFSQLCKEPFCPEKETDLLQEAENSLQRACHLGHDQAAYALVCLYSLFEQIDQAMFFLKKAEDADALPPLDEILHDEWLENLRRSPLFKEFLQGLENQKNVKGRSLS